MKEFDFIRRLREQTGSRKHSSRVVKEMGDDASVISEIGNRDLVVTTDLLVEGVDFYRDAAPARLLGHKALAVSLSDIAAMGARPLWSLVSIGMPVDVWRDDFKDSFFEGYFALADQYGVTLVGGDVSEAKEQIVIDSIVVGEVIAGRAILRSTAQPGDQIFVTGMLGGAAAGLKLIEMGARLGATGLTSLPVASKLSSSRGQEAGGSRQEDESRSQPGSSPTNRGPRAGSPRGVVDREGSASKQNAEGGRQQKPDTAETKAIERLLLRQLRPAARVGWGIVLSEERLASAMIDISDGLSSDLAHLCRESNVGALLQSAPIPIDKDVSKLCGRRALDPLALALHGGEDFELLFTVRPDDVTRLPKRVDGVAVFRIGEVTDEPGAIRIAEKNRVWNLQPQGFQHFSRSV